MNDLFQSINIVISKITQIIGIITNTFIENEIFQLILGIVAFIIGFGFLFDIIARLSFNAPENSLRKKYVNWRYIPKDISKTKYKGRR